MDMLKILFRSVAVLLVFCLIANPSTVSAFSLVPTLGRITSPPPENRQTTHLYKKLPMLPLAGCVCAVLLHQHSFIHVFGLLQLNHSVHSHLPVFMKMLALGGWTKGVALAVMIPLKRTLFVRGWPTRSVRFLLLTAMWNIFPDGYKDLGSYAREPRTLLSLELISDSKLVAWQTSGSSIYFGLEKGGIREPIFWIDIAYHTISAVSALTSDGAVSSVLETVETAIWLGRFKPRTRSIVFFSPMG